MGHHYLLAKIWRWHDNPLLSQLRASDTLYLLRENLSSYNLPFYDLPHLDSRFQRESEQNLNSFADSLPFPIVKISNPCEIPAKMLKAYYFFDDYYLQSLKGRDVDFISPHPMHFCSEAQARESITPRSSFTEFKQKLEAIDIYSQRTSLTTSASLAERNALDELESYFHGDAPHRYLDERNEFEAASAGTHVSYPLAHGLLSPQRILSELHRFEGLKGESKSTYWIKFELLWREFFYFTQLFSTRKLYFSDALNPSPLERISIAELIRELAEGPLICAMLNELITTGLLSNRCRQIFASYFVHLNKYDWRYGAYLFQYFLKDYDPSSNWGNWQYLAGVGRDPRGLRFFNLETQMQRYNPDRTYLKKWGAKKDFLLSAL